MFQSIDTSLIEEVSLFSDRREKQARLMGSAGEMMGPAGVGVFFSREW